MAATAGTALAGSGLAVTAEGSESVGWAVGPLGWVDEHDRRSASAMRAMARRTWQLVVTNAVYAGDWTASSGLDFAIEIVYLIGLWTYWNGQTIGNKLLGIRVVKTDGSPLNLVTAVVRFVGLIISLAVVFIGVI